MTVGFGSITLWNNKERLLNENIERNEVEDIVAFVASERDKKEKKSSSSYWGFYWAIIAKNSKVMICLASITYGTTEKDS